MPIRSITLLTKRADMSREEFNEYWRGVHGDIGKSLPHVLRYSQLHLIEDSDGDGQPLSGHDYNVDAIVDLVFDDADNLTSVWESEAGKRAIEDGPNFLSSWQEYLVEEISMVERLGVGVVTERPVSDEIV